MPNMHTPAREGEAVTTEGRQVLIEVATQLLVRGGIPEPAARAAAASSPDLQDDALPLTAALQRLVREMQEPVAKLNAVLAAEGTSMAEFAAKVRSAG